MLGTSFKIIEYDFVCLSLEEKIKDVLKRTIFRRKFYKNGLLNFKTTSLFVARKTVGDVGGY